MKIVVTGDVCINTLQWIGPPPNHQGLDWQKHYNVKNVSKGGEALLLSDLIRLSTGLEVLSPKLENGDLDFIQSTVELELFSKYVNNSSEKVYRVNRFSGFTGPSCGLTRLLPVLEDDPFAKLVIIDDEGNGFSNNKKYWPKSLEQENHFPIVFYKMNKPAGTSEMWYHLERKHWENTVVIINSEDIRSQGVNISKSLSWERTAEDFVWQLNNNPSLIFLTKCRHLVVPFGLEGCIYYQNNGSSQSQLYFLPYEIEDNLGKSLQGKMYGLTSCFVAALARSVAAEPIILNKLDQYIGEGIKEGIVAARNYFIEGFGNCLDELHFPISSIFHENNKKFIIKEHVQEVKIPNLTQKRSQDLWYILNDKSSTSLAEIAYDIVKNGEDQALRYIPFARFGSLKVIDRIEIESYRSIKNLMREYIDNKNTVRPLSIAVFGTPGSGKSYGITEVAASIAPDKIIKLTFNLSQFTSTDDLIRAFHRARDYSLLGKLPLMIFDEFDSEFKGKLGWLKYLLAPMQDGLFREGDSEHPIGKAIFVFAGGTSSTFNEFCGETIDNPDEQVRFTKSFRNSKGLDFISRLRGYVNILGPNPVSEQDELYVIRRAMVLRSLIKIKTSHLIDKKGVAQIDNGVLRAMLKVPRFKHETRSMEAILDMSMLNEAKKWEQSYLPSKEQLKLHVDEEQFMRCLMHDAFFSEKTETLACFLFNKYNEISENVMSWQAISEAHRNFYFDLARNLPDSMFSINYDIASVNERPVPIIFDKVEVETLAKYEHGRWLLHKKNRGWEYGEILDENKKTSPFITSYNLLPVNKRKQIIQFVSSWSEALAFVNFKLESRRK